MNIIIIYKSICQFIIKSKLIIAIILCFWVNDTLAQSNDWELKEIIRQRYYKDYVKDFYLIHFGKDSVKAQLTYRYTELYSSYFNKYRFFVISLTNGGSVAMTYCITSTGEILDKYFINYNALLVDSKVKLNSLEKSILVYLIADERPLNWIITSDTTFNKCLTSNDFKRYALEDRRGNLYKNYPVRFRKNNASFYVYKINMSNDDREIIKYNFRYKKGELKSIEYKFICTDN